MNRRLFALALAGMTLTGCGKSLAPPASSDPAPPGPALDTTAAQALLTPDEILQSIALAHGIQDTADTTGTAAPRGGTDGPTASLVATRASTYLIRPFQPRAMARREEKGTYSLGVSVR